MPMAPDNIGSFGRANECIHLSLMVQLSVCGPSAENRTAKADQRSRASLRMRFMLISPCVMKCSGAVLRSHVEAERAAGGQFLMRNREVGTAMAVEADALHVHVPR